jgi:hypothetical protein
MNQLAIAIPLGGLLDIESLRQFMLGLAKGDPTKSDIERQP